MPLDFSTFATNGELFLHELSKELGCPNDRKRAARVLRAVLRATRDRISVEESFQLMAQLPMFLKAVYVDGWTLKHTLEGRSTARFIEHLRSLDRADRTDLPDEEAAAHAVRGVFFVMRNYLSTGELADIAAQLPKELKELVLGNVPRS